MENNRIVEVVTGGINKRNTLMPYNNYLELESKNAFKKEMYRSYYMFDDTFNQHVSTHKSVKG